MSMELQIGTGKAAAALAQIERSVANLEARLKSFSGGNLDTTLNKLGSFGGVNQSAINSVDRFSASINGIKVSNISNVSNALSRLASINVSSVTVSVGRLSSALAGIQPSSGGQALVNQFRQVQAAATATTTAVTGLRSALAGINVPAGLSAMAAQLNTTKTALTGATGAAREFTGASGALASTLSGFGVALGGLGIARFVASAWEMVNVTTRIKGLFDAIVPGAESGAEALAFLNKEADRTSTDFKALAQSFSTFGANAILAGYDVQQTQDIFSKLTTVMRAMNLNTEQSKRTFKGFEQIITKGAFSMEELRQQIGENIPAFSTLAEVMGVSGKELQDMMKQGQVGIEWLIPLVDRLNDKLGVGFQNALKTPQAAMNDFINGFNRLALAFGNAAFEKVAPLLRDVGRNMSAAADGSNTFLNAAGQLASILGTVLVSALQFTVNNTMLVVSAYLLLRARLIAVMALTVAQWFVSAAQGATALVTALMSASRAVYAFATANAVGTASSFTLSGALSALRIAAMALLPMLGLFAIGVGLAAAAVLIWENRAAIAEAVTWAWNAAVETLSGLWNALVSYISSAVTAVAEWVEWVDTSLGISAAWSAAINGISSAIQTVIGWIGQAAAAIRDTFVAAWNSASAAVQNAANIIIGAIRGIIDWVGRAISELMRLIGLQSSVGGGGGETIVVGGGKEGGISHEGLSSTHVVSADAFKNAPHFATGGVTGGGAGAIPAILHPNEAVIPLQGGAVPVTISTTGSTGSSSEGINILTASWRELREIKDCVDVVNQSVRNMGSAITTEIEIVQGYQIEIIDKLQKLCDYAKESMVRMESSRAAVSGGGAYSGGTDFSSVGGSYGVSGGSSHPSQDISNWSPEKLYSAGLITEQKYHQLRQASMFGYNDPGRAGYNLLGGGWVNTNYDQQRAAAKSWFEQGQSLTLTDGRVIQGYGAASGGGGGLSSFGGGFASGTPNTSMESLTAFRGGYLTQVHDNEAIIPLPDGRSVPVTFDKSFFPNLVASALGSPASERSGGGKVVVNMVVNATDAGSFKRTKDQIAQDLARSIENAQKRIGQPVRDDLTAPSAFRESK